MNHSPENYPIHSWLKGLRLQHKLSLREVSAQTGLTTRKISATERGIHEADLVTVAAYCRLFRQKFDFIQGYEFPIGGQSTVLSQTAAAMLKHRRTQRSISLRSLAEMLGCSVSRLQRLEADQASSISFSLALELDQVLEMDGSLVFQMWQEAMQQPQSQASMVNCDAGICKACIPAQMPELSCQQSFWRNRLAPVLWSIAGLGLSIVEAIAWKLDIEKRKLYLPLKRLVDRGILHQVRTTLIAPVSMYWLSENGKRFCEQSLGWRTVESGYEKLLNQHAADTSPRHAALCLLFAHHAVIQGYTVELLPMFTTGQPKSPLTGHIQTSLFEDRYQPDLLIWNGEEHVYVEAEIKARGKEAKWLLQEKTQGFVVFCTLTESRKRWIMQEVRRAGVQKVIGIVLPGKETGLRASLACLSDH